MLLFNNGLKKKPHWNQIYILLPVKGTCLFVRWLTKEQSARFSSPFHTIIPLKMRDHCDSKLSLFLISRRKAVSLPSIRATLLAGWPHTGLVSALPVSSLLGPPICSLIVRSRCESLNRRPWPGAQIMTRCVSLAAEAKLPLGAELPWK